MFNKASSAALYALKWSSYSIGRMLRLRDDVSELIAVFVASLILLMIVIRVCGLVAKWIA